MVFPLYIGIELYVNGSVVCYIVRLIRAVVALFRHSLLRSRCARSCSALYYLLALSGTASERVSRSVALFAIGAVVVYCVYSVVSRRRYRLYA
jgi:hypothetical protein